MQPSYAPARHQTQPIRAELVGSYHCTACGLTAQGETPILAICRALIAAGHDPATPLLVYRGNTVALTISSIGDAATLEVNGKGTGFMRCPEPVGIAPPMRKFRLPDVIHHRARWKRTVTQAVTDARGDDP